MGSCVFPSPGSLWRRVELSVAYWDHKQEAGLPEGTWGPLAHGSLGVLVGAAAGVGGTEVQKQ